MPRNSRPGTFFGDWDLEWKGSTRTERKLAQNQYDLEEQLEKLNNKLDNLKSDDSSDRETTYIDLALITNTNRDELSKYMNKYNQQVISETPNIVKVIKDEKDANRKLDSNKGSRLYVKNVSYMCMPLAFIFGIFGCVAASLSFITSILALLCGVVVWIILTDGYIRLMYGTQEHDEEELDKIIDSKVMSPTYKKFREFRIRHYNQNMEALINEYLTNNIRSYYGNLDKYDGISSDYISDDEIIAYGTPEDYMNYLRENFGE